MMFSASSNILAFLVVWIDRIAVFWSSGVEVYGKYVVLNGAVMFAAGIINALGQSFFPTLVRSVKGIGEAPPTVWEAQMRVSLVLCAPVCAFFFVDPVFVREFFFGRNAIVPPGFDLIVRCLSLYGYLGALVRATNFFLLSAGRNEISGVLNAISAVLYFPTVFAVAYQYGAVGVAIGSLVYMSAYFMGFVYVTGRIFTGFPAVKMLIRALFSLSASMLCLVLSGQIMDRVADGLATKIVLVGTMIVLTVGVLAFFDTITRKMIHQVLAEIRLRFFPLIS
jgi:O-antigen/teichoic acid export membrane protein